MARKGVINEFNDSVRIDEVYEIVTGYRVKSGNCKCPFHNSENDNNAAINIARNCITCFSHRCVTKMKPYEFIAKYHGLENEKFPVIARKVNEYYPNSFKIYSDDNEEFLKEKKDCVLSNFYIKVEADLRKKIKDRIDMLNDFFLNKYGIESNINKMNQLWSYVKVNEFYCSVADYIKIDERIIAFKINEEKLNIEIINKVLKFRNRVKDITSDKRKKYIIETGKKIADKYKKNPSNELEEILEKYRFEYKLINIKSIENKKRDILFIENLKISNRAGLEYLEYKNIEKILNSNDSYDLNKQICEAISEQEKDAFICGNIDYTISIIHVKPFNYEKILLDEAHIRYINNELKDFREKIESKFKDRYFCDKELYINKKCC